MEVLGTLGPAQSETSEVRWIHVLGSIQQQYEAIAFHNN
jgi:hypothetical protein